MPDDLFIFSDDSSTPYIALARTRQGKLFRKQILRFGSFTHPANPSKRVTVDEAFADALIKNFNDGVTGVVQFPVVNDQNMHVENPLNNLGEVVGVEKDAEGVNAIIDVRKYTEDIGKTLIGASAMINPAFRHKVTNEIVGPTLIHVAQTNNPYLPDLDNFKEIISASNDISDSEVSVVQLANAELNSTEGTTDVEVTSSSNEGDNKEMTLEELLAELKEKHNLDVAALQAEAAKAEEVATKNSELEAQVAQADESKTLVAALSDALNKAGVGSGETDSIELSNVIDSVAELAADNQALASAVKTQNETLAAMKLSATETEVDSLVAEAKILPAQRDAMVQLALSDRELFEKLVPSEPLVALSAQGVETHDAPGATKDLDDKVSKYLSLATKK